MSGIVNGQEVKGGYYQGVHVLNMDVDYKNIEFVPKYSIFTPGDSHPAANGAATLMSYDPELKQAKFWTGTKVYVQHGKPWVNIKILELPDGFVFDSNNTLTIERLYGYVTVDSFKFEGSTLTASASNSDPQFQQEFLPNPFVFNVRKI